LDQWLGGQRERGHAMTTGKADLNVSDPRAALSQVENEAPGRGLTSARNQKGPLNGDPWPVQIVRE